MGVGYALAWAPGAPNLVCGNNKDRVVNDGPAHSTLREWRLHLRHPATLVAMAAVALILALVAPYGTDNALRPVPRLAYWAVIVPATYATGSLVVTVLRRVLPPWPFVLRMIVAGGVAGCAVAGVVLGVNAAALGVLPASAALPGFVLNVAGVALVVTLGVSFASHSLLPTEQPRNAPPPILQRLKLEKRGTLLALSVDDHYVHVQTDKGTEMLLMRLSDAVNETGDLLGAQVHRSHWVAFGAVRAGRRDGDRAILTLVSGAEIPVSRANVAKVKEAGLLP